MSLIGFDDYKAIIIVTNYLVIKLSTHVECTHI